MSTKWYNKSKIPKLWRNRIKQTLNGMGDVSDLTDVGESTSDDTNLADMGKSEEIKRGTPDLIEQHPGGTAEEGGHDAHPDSSGEFKHRHPLMQFVGLFNEITSLVQTEDFFEVDEIDRLIEVGEIVLDSLTDTSELTNLAESLDNLYELRDQIIDNESFDDQYESWFLAYNYLRRTGAKFSKYTADVQSPDIVFDYDDEYMPEEAIDNLESIEDTRDGIDEFFGISDSIGSISENPRQASPSDEDDFYDGVDEFLVPRSFTDDETPEPQISPKMLKSWKSRHGVQSVKHTLSLRQLLKAYNKARSKVMANNGGWVMSSTMFSGLSNWELDALTEEGLIKVQSGKMTLTRLGYEKPQWYRY